MGDRMIAMKMEILRAKRDERRLVRKNNNFIDNVRSI